MKHTNSNPQKYLFIFRNERHFYDTYLIGYIPAGDKNIEKMCNFFNKTDVKIGLRDTDMWALQKCDGFVSRNDGKQNVPIFIQNYDVFCLLGRVIL